MDILSNFLYKIQLGCKYNYNFINMQLFWCYLHKKPQKHPYLCIIIRLMEQCKTFFVEYICIKSS